METRFCLTCDKEFAPRAHEDEFCSQECAVEYEEFCAGDDEYFEDDDE